MKAIRLVVVGMMLSLALMGCIGNSGSSGDNGKTPIPPSLEIISAVIDDPEKISLTVGIKNNGGAGSWKWESKNQTFDENGNVIGFTATREQSGLHIEAGETIILSVPEHYASPLRPGRLGKITFEATVIATGETATWEKEYTVP